MAAAIAVLRAALRRGRPAAAALLHQRPNPSARSLPPPPPLGRALPPLPRLGFSASFGYSTATEESTPAARPKGKAKVRKNPMKQSRFDFTKVDAALLPTVILVGRPNVGKSALFNRFIRRREAVVYNTRGDHVTRDIREGVAKLGDLRFRVLDSAGLETAATSGSILARTADMTGNVLARSQFAIFLIDVRDGLQPLDLEVGQWLRKHASGIHTLVAMNKSESLDEHGLLTAAAGEAHKLGFGDPVAISAETGLVMAELYEILRPLFEEYMFQLLNNDLNQDDPISEVETEAHEGDESKLPLQLAIVGRPNVGKSTLLNTLLQEQRVLVGPEAGLTRDSIRAQFQFDNRTVYLVDTAGWMERSGKEKGSASLSVVQSRKNLMRAHIVALVLDAEKIAKSKSSMNHPEVVIARQAIEEGRGLVVIVNKMDLLRDNQTLFNKVMDAVPSEIQTVIPQHKPTGKMASPPSVNNENYDPKVDKARKANSNDPGWKYGYWADLQKRDQVTCTLCDTMVCGGIKRLKQHLAGGYGDAKMCPRTTTAIRKEMTDYLESIKRRRPLFIEEGDQPEEPADVVVVEAIAAPAVGAESVQVEDTARAESQASKVQPSSGTAAKQRLLYKFMD